MLVLVAYVQNLTLNTHADVSSWTRGLKTLVWAFIFVCLFDLILYVPVNIFSAMSERVLLGWTSTKQRIKCLAQGHNTVPPVRLEPATPLSPDSLSQRASLWAFIWEKQRLWWNGPRRKKTCLRGFAKNTGADQPAHPRSLISAFVIRFLESIIGKLATG